MSEICVGTDAAFPPGSTNLIEVGGVEIAILNEAGALYAYRNVCPHQGGPVCEGVRMPRVIEKVGPDGRHMGNTFDEAEPLIICPWHGYSFKVKSGENVCDSNIRLRRYQVRRDGGQVYVTV